MGSWPAGEIVPGRDIIQVFRAASDFLSVVSPLVATYRGQAGGSLTLSLHRLAAPATHGWHDWLGWRVASPLAPGPPLATVQEAGADLEDNASVHLFASPIADSAGVTFVLRLRASGTGPGSAPTAWLSDGDERIPGHVACYVGNRRQGARGLKAEVLYAPPTAATAVPEAILYSPVTQCNLNCIHCISRDTRATARRLPQAIKAQILEWARDGRLRFVATDYSGDILWADARHPGELAFVVSLGVPFHVDTNGAYLTADVCRRLAASHLHSLNVSLDAATEETYRRVRRGAPPLARVAENIRTLVDERARAGAQFALSLSFTLMRSTLHEWPAFLQMASGLGIGTVVARHLEAYTADMGDDSLWLDQQRYNRARAEALGLADQLGISLAAPAPFAGGGAVSGHLPCPEPWRSAVVLGNGDVAACCVPGMTMGNLHDHSMEQIWNGPRYAELRLAVNSPRPPPTCNACPMYRRHNNPDSYLFHRVRSTAG